MITIAVAAYANAIGVVAIVLGKKMATGDFLLAGASSCLALSCVGRLFDNRPGQWATTLLATAVFLTACTYGMLARPFEHYHANRLGMMNYSSSSSSSEAFI